MKSKINTASSLVTIVPCFAKISIAFSGVIFRLLLVFIMSMPIGKINNGNLGSGHLTTLWCVPNNFVVIYYKLSNLLEQK